ncbi:hypothetical protein SCLCIDRAFT_278545 [Scleroderma citrinum Foug A]|uniref:Secreted protein n=1 Tax=Scleroderma citrinum Foug A TaxID=1036808 RepID=A0A0C2Z286_9AGAM|nr:hypothetical protein SCLCIDRAFT_278545 [Scleroderma citrinum Foug A]
MQLHLRFIMMSLALLFRLLAALDYCSRSCNGLRSPSLYRPTYPAPHSCITSSETLKCSYHSDKLNVFSDIATAVRCVCMLRDFVLAPCSGKCCDSILLDMITPPTSEWQPNLYTA